jgi:hypothetical protein
MNEGISAENECLNRPKRKPLDEENRQIAKTVISTPKHHHRGEGCSPVVR